MKGFKNTTKMKSGHSFPSSHGFTGSASGKPPAPPWVHKLRARYAEGGSVAPSKSKPTMGAPRKISPGITGAIKDAVGALSNAFPRRSRIDQAAQRADRYAEGGSVDSALTRRDQPVTDADRARGGTSPLAPGFRKGGASKIGRKC